MFNADADFKCFDFYILNTCGMFTLENMSLPPEKATELKQIIHDHLIKVT